jgi:hypothetical protein
MGPIAYAYLSPDRRASVELGIGVFVRGRLDIMGEIRNTRILGTFPEYLRAVRSTPHDVE